MRKGLLVLGIVVALTVGAGTALAAAQAGSANGRASMHDRMSGTPMGSMMGSVDMDAMHLQMRDLMPADVRAACDEAHAQTNEPGSTGGQMPMDHTAHHTADR